LRAREIEAVDDADKADATIGEALQKLERLGSVPSQAIEPRDNHRIGSRLPLIEQPRDLSATRAIDKASASRDTEVLNHLDQVCA
jgi:hypothetical protein